MKSVWTTILSIALLAPAALAQGDEATTNAEQPVRAKLSDAAKLAFETIAGLEKGLKGKKGPERAAALQAIAEQCERSAREFEAEPAAAMRGWYQAGEAWRRHGTLERAAEAFGCAIAQADDRYRSRALFGLAEMQRRAKQLDAAIKTYGECAAFEPKTVRAHDARLWIARCHGAAERHDEAIQAFRAACGAAPGPRQRIEAGNWIAKALISRGELDAAAAELAAVEAAIAADLRAGGTNAERLQRALDEMSARRALTRARDKATDAAADAVDVERAGVQETPIP
ncbi:MAG: hypothetical protein KDB80_03345 [Planctomycetes bacterium]|nr:hypothetical protein [Planctomycetota bacterium]